MMFNEKNPFIGRSRRTAQGHYLALREKCGVDNSGQYQLDIYIAKAMAYLKNPIGKDWAKSQSDLAEIWPVYEACLSALERTENAPPGPKGKDKSKGNFETLLYKGRRFIHCENTTRETDTGELDVDEMPDVARDNMSILQLIGSERFLDRMDGFTPGLTFDPEAMGYDFFDSSKEATDDIAYGHYVAMKMQDVTVQCLRNTAFNLMRPGLGRSTFKNHEPNEYELQLEKQFITNEGGWPVQYNFAPSYQNLFLGKSRKTAQKNYLELREKCGQDHKQNYHLDSFVCSFLYDLNHTPADKETINSYIACSKSLGKHYNTEISRDMLFYSTCYMLLMQEYGGQDLGLIKTKRDKPSDSIIVKMMHPYHKYYSRIDNFYLLQNERSAAAAMELISTQHIGRAGLSKTEQARRSFVINNIFSPLHEISAQCLRNFAFGTINDKPSAGFKSHEPKQYDGSLDKMRIKNPSQLDLRNFPKFDPVWKRSFQYPGTPMRL